MKIGNTGHKISQESFKTRMKTIFYNLDIKNNICPDCGKTKSMDYASINNGIIICAECAKEHEKLGYNISFLRSLGDKWDDYLFNYIKAGGNSRFIQFCKDYKIDKGNSNIIQKYKSKGLTYYRDIIRSEVLGYDPPDNINVNKAYEEEPEIPDNYPEFKKYSFVKHVDKNYMETNFYTRKEEKPKEEEDEGFFGKIGGLWGSVKKRIGDEADDLMKKVSEIDYNSVKEKGASMFDYFFGDDKEKNNNESANKINEKEKTDKNEDNSILKNIFGVNTKTYEKDKNINQIGNNYEKIEENDKSEYNNKEENKNTQIKENKNEQKEEKEEKKEIKKDEQKEEKKEEKKEEIKEEKKEEIKEKQKEEKKEGKKEEIKEDKKEEIKEEKKEEIKEEKIEEKKKDKNEQKTKEKKEEQKEEIKEEQNVENKDEKNEDKAKEKEKNNSNNIIEKEDEQNKEKEKKDNKQEENAETKNYDIENILNDNTFSNDNTKMNNEEKDELEKMLQE